MNTDSQWSEHGACFARATQVRLAVYHNTSNTSGERVRCLKRIARAVSLPDVNQISFIYETMNGCENLINSLKDCFENVNIK